jgi:uncharacterized protein (TIGR02996 family)
MSPSPTTLEQAFLDDIVAHPEDPSRWLILSDWLEDQNDPRAELVRLTAQLQSEPDDADFPRRQERVQVLLAGGMVPVRPRCTLGDFEFVWIPPGSFFMGSPREEPGHVEAEKRHRVTLTHGFWMGVYPVTQTQWQAVRGTNPSYFARHPLLDSLKQVSDADLASFPVESISWNAAEAFCVEVGKQLGRRISLPSEAQWEYACRAGSTTPFFWGEDLGRTRATCGTYSGGGAGIKATPGRPTPVGSYLPNAWGLYDMHGNVWEWCLDAYRKNNTRLSARDPLPKRGPSNMRVMRGGSWFDIPLRARCAYRHQVAQNTGASALGLRVCCLD